jgi:hypothetical protein
MAFVVFADGSFPKESEGQIPSPQNKVATFTHYGTDCWVVDTTLETSPDVPKRSNATESHGRLQKKLERRWSLRNGSDRVLSSESLMFTRRTF